MSGNQVIPDAAVEAAANAISEASGMRFDGFWSRVGDLEPEDREYALMEARAALEAAAPHIQAQALEDAATELDDKRLLSKAFHIFYPEWLRERAAKLTSK